MIGLVRWKTGAVKEAISLCGGLEKLRANDRVLIKPNLPVGGKILREAPGTSTSPDLIEELLQLLHDHGVKKITIGEGSVVIPSADSTTASAFFFAGYLRLRRRYDVRLVDFNEGEFVDHFFDGKRISVSTAAHQHDFLINAPVLKTHVQTGVSLGMKNLKGLLAMGCKQLFHREGLHVLIAALSRIVRSDLVVVDGRLAMEWGPIGGAVKSADLVVAGTDVLDVDRVGSLILGVDPATVEHLSHYATMTGRTMEDLVDVRGESIERLKVPCRWKPRHGDCPYQGWGGKGLRVVFEDLCSVCCMCDFALKIALDQLSRAGERPDFTGIELVMGNNAKKVPGCPRTILFGNCPIEADPDRTNKVLIKGCPPPVDDILNVLRELGRPDKHNA